MKLTLMKLTLMGIAAVALWGLSYVLSVQWVRGWAGANYATDLVTTAMLFGLVRAALFVSGQILRRID